LAGFFLLLQKKSYKVQDYLNELNKAQKAAVVNTDGPALVIAGAGSGKTRVLTYRIAHLLEKGVDPSKILSLTFTNKAAREMKERIGEIIGAEKAALLWMGTFHSVFARILRYEAEHIGFPSSFTIYDAQDARSLVNSIIKQLELNDNYKPRDIYSKISKAKNNLVTSAVYSANQNFRITDEKSLRPEFHRIYSLYERRCFEAGSMDFDDLLLKTNILFRDHPEVLRKYQERFRYILVDEYQDTNYSQYLIIKKLAEQHKNVCVVGDDAQSIYAFRGAKIENILNFRKDYKDYKLFKLERNYRSTSNIVEAANSVIEKNKSRIEKKVFAHGGQGDKIKIIRSLTDNEEGFKITNIINDSIYRDHTKYSDHAILYRTNAQSRIFEEALRKRNIPYKVYGGTSFYQRKEIKDILAYYKFTVNPKDNESLKRIINYPRRGIGNTTLERIENYADANDISMWETIEKSKTIDINLNSRALNQIYGFASVMDDFMQKLPVTDACSLAKQIASESGILKELHKSKAPEEIVRHENVQELLNGIKEFTDTYEEADKVTLDKFLEEVSLLTDMDNESEEDKNKVSLMTIHAAKGLEFRNVYIVGVEEGLFPGEMSAQSPKDLEEERRLFYVAITRAEKELIISYAGQRYRWGKLIDSVASRFIKDIDRQYIDDSEDENSNNFRTPSFRQKTGFKPNKKSYTKKPFIPKNKNSAAGSVSITKTNKSLSSKEIQASNIELPDSMKFIEPGKKVKHAKFGTGTVLALEQEMPNTKASIDFPGIGTKTLLLKFAKLQACD